ncbi:MAG: cytochrome c biogenesis protein CcsA [Gemmatimonadaceae bacterium]|nr:cytochrome c biogenesis protein CcsA [Gemmatimonadaceae bacterium]
MMAVGAAALWFALLMMVASAALLVVGPRRAGPAGLVGYVAGAGASVLAVLALGQALVQHDFTLRYVAQFTSLMLDTQPAITALWAGQAGMLLLFTALVGVCGAAAVALHRGRPLLPIGTATVAAVSVAGLAALCFGVSPFARLASAPQEGRGLDPQLLHQAMLWQPPLMLLGLALTSVPFGFTVAHWFRSASPPVDADAEAEHEVWRGLVQRWVLVAWSALTIAITIGCWWAQQQLGWFGYFFTWEPYASAPVLPWVALSALLFLLVSGADRVRAAVWLAALVAFTFLLAVFAVVRARSGIAASIRAVAASPSLFVLVLTGAGLVLLALTGWLASRQGTATRAASRAGVGGLLTLVGVAVTAVALIATPWRRELTTGLDIGQVAEVRDPFGAAWRFTSQGLSSYQEPAYTVVAVALNATRNGRRIGLLNSQQRQYFDAQDNEIFEPVTRVGSRHLPHETVTLAFLGPIDRTSAAVRVSFVPLVNALWMGVALTVLGVVLAAWPLVPLPAPVSSRSAPRLRPLLTPLPPSPDGVRAFCTACGARLVTVDARFCAECGEPVG